MSAGYQDQFLNQGETFNTEITLAGPNGAAYNLVGFSVKSQAKTSYYAANATIVFDTSIMDPANGVILLSANSASTANLSSRQKLVYDVIIRDDSSNNVTRVLEGQIFVNPAVTLF